MSYNSKYKGAEVEALLGKAETALQEIPWSILKESSKAGDIAYWDGSKVKTVSQEKWDTSLGTPVGVVVVPKGFAPDGKARMLSLKYVKNPNGANPFLGTSEYEMMWILDGGYNTDMPLVAYGKVPTTDNAGSTTTGSSNYGYLPSDKFAGSTSFVDPIAKYNTGYSGDMTPYIPSPYLGDKPNPAYYTQFQNDSNPLSDFDGKGKTDLLVALGTDFVAANQARNYKVEDTEGIEWYLPAMGELGYMISRFNKIQDALISLNAQELRSGGHCSSSGAYYIFALDLLSGEVEGEMNSKYHYYVRPFAIID